MGYRMALSLPLALTLALTVATVTGAEYPCPYEECECSSVRIDCGYKGLTTVPALKAGDFPQTELFLSGNKISSISADQLPPGLEKIMLYGNPLTHLADDVFSLSADTLLVLSLSNTKTNYIPDLSYLEELEELSLQDNNITDAAADVSLPATLQKLDLTRNSLTHIPAQVSQLHHLTELHLAFNKIINIDTFIFPSSLEMIMLAYNPIEDVSSISFSDNSPNIERILLYHTPLKHISPTAFSQLTHLKSLHLDYNKLTRLPLALKSLTRVTYLRLDGQDITCTCEEAELASWYATRPKRYMSMGRCDDGTTVQAFLTEVAPNCPNR